MDGNIHEIAGRQVYEKKASCSKIAQHFVEELEGALKVTVTERIPKIWNEKKPHMALDSKDFSNEFNVGVYCVHKENQAKLYVRISNLEIIMTKALQKNS